MAKKSKLIHKKQVEQMVQKFRAKRDELRKRSLDMKLTLEERMEARAALDLLPTNSAAVRVKNRCKVTGRARGYIRRLGISRVAIRRMAHAGVLPGLTKASW
jgi:small subunit ribosomal protein S14